MTAPIIAILDEDPSFLSAMQALLIPVGYRTLRCRPNDVVDVYALVKRYQPALVILDRGWGRGSDGWEFLKHLWADPQTTQIGVVLTAGQTLRPSLQAEALRTMCCQVVRTPVDRRELLRAIEAVLGPLSIGQIPDRQVALVPVPVSVATARGLDQLLEVSPQPRAVARGAEALLRLTVAARVARRGFSALDAASDS
ncbi:MAG: response regulator [Chloroflexota bacterium]|nr:response regulator [Chloroflexota bacterium]